MYASLPFFSQDRGKTAGGCERIEGLLIFRQCHKTYESSFLPCLVNIYGRHASNYRSPTLIRRFKSTRTEDKLYNF